MANQVITYNLSQQITANLEYISAPVARVVALEILLESLPLTLYISLAELKKRILDGSTKRKISKLADLLKVLELLVQRLAKQCALKLSLVSGEFIASADSDCQLQLLKGYTDISGMLYLGKISLDNLLSFLQKRHQDYMLKFSCALNHPLIFPVVIGEVIISRRELLGLKPGNLLFFDRLTLPQASFSCQINNLRADIEAITE